MRVPAVVCIAGLLAACSSERTPTPFDAVVTFSLAGAKSPDATTTRPATAFLVLEKPGRKVIVNTGPDGAGEGQQYGRHRFPPYCGAAVVAGYFDGLLSNAGWTDADYRIVGAELRVFGVLKVEAGVTGTEIQVRIERTAGS